MVGYKASIPDGRTRDISVQRQADYLVGFLRHLGIERAVLAGHDLGGGVVQIAAVHYPGLCRGRFLINSIAYDSWSIPSVRAMRAAGLLVGRLPNAVFQQVLRAFYRRCHDDISRQSR
jgi:pimeloyl-ACP methyl ester carboxylesterase